MKSSPSPDFDAHVRETLPPPKGSPHVFAICTSCGHLEVRPTDSCSRCWGDSLYLPRHGKCGS